MGERTEGEAYERRQPIKTGVSGKRRLVAVLAGIFILVFGLTWFLSRWSDRGETEAFVQAVLRNDFFAMRDIGKNIFRRGADARAIVGLLAGREANSLPPYKVYVLHHGAMDGKISRVLLTLDDDDRVVSFVAEEMSVIQ